MKPRTGGSRTTPAQSHHHKPSCQAHNIPVQTRPYTEICYNILCTRTLLCSCATSAPNPKRDFRPQSKLVTPTTHIEKPRFPAIDAHNHLGADFGGGWDQKPLSQLLDLLDEAGIVKYIDLDGGWGEDLLNAHLDHFKQPAPERFQVFGGVDWAQWPDRGAAFPAWAANRLRIWD